MNFDPRINQLGSQASTLHTSASVTGAIAATAAITAIVAVIIFFTLPLAAVVAPIIAVSGGGVALLALIASITLVYNKYTTLQRMHLLQGLNTQVDDLDKEDEDKIVPTIAKIDSKQPSPSVNEDPLIALVKANDHVGVLDFLAKEGKGRSDTHLDERQNSPLIWAAYKGYYEIVKTLIENGADVSHQSVEGITVLMNGAHSGDTKIVQLLLDCGATVNQQTNVGTTALIFAAADGHVNVVQLLLDRGASVNPQDNEKPSALKFAAYMGHLHIVQLLLRSGAKAYSIVNGNPLSSPYGVALQQSHQQVAEILEAHLTSKERLDCREALTLKAVGHSTHQEGNLTFNSSNKGATINVELEGASGTSYWLNKMMKCTELLLRNNHAPFSPEVAKKLISLLESAAASSPDEAWTRYKNGHPSLIMTGYIGHASSVLIWGPYFILCDRGGVSGVPIKIYKFDPDQIDQSFFNQLLSLKSKSKESYSQFLKEWAPRRVSDSFEFQLLNNFPFGMQTVGNCSMACLEGAAWAFLALRKLFARADGTFDETIVPKKSTITRALNQTTEEVRDWLLYHQIYQMERYIGVRVLRSQDPVKIKKSKDKRKGIELNYDFYTSTMDYLAGELESRKQRQNRLKSGDDRLEEALLALSNGLSNVLQD